MALALLVLSLGSRAFAASWSFGVTGGAGLPTGDLADEQKGNATTGFQVGGLVGYAVNEKFSFGVDGSYVQNKNDDEGKTVTGFDLSDFDPTLTGTADVKFDKLKYNTVQIGAHAKYMFPMQNSPLAPYALVGLGVYNTTFKAELTETGSGAKHSEDFKFDTKFGGKVGLGAMWKASPTVGVGLEANYNFISEDKDKTGFDSGQYVDVHAGVTYTIAHGATK